MALAPTSAGRVSTAVFGVTAILLFGTSAVYHRFNWSPRPLAVLRRMDHTNIFLIIAGTYTPLAVLLLPAATARVLLIVVWSGALAGVLARVFWLGAPRWFYMLIYVAPRVGRGVVPRRLRAHRAHRVRPDDRAVRRRRRSGLHARRGRRDLGHQRPNWSPRWFGFHEVFHSLTVVGYATMDIAVSIAAYTVQPT